ncbi:hypothetical protein ACP4OV_021575 [Aristida adscensionis]
MDENSGESRSVEAMSIFAQSFDVRRPGRSRRRDTHKNKSPEIEQPVSSNVDRMHLRKAVAERERARAESELSRARTMARELESQIEQAGAKARSHRSELQGTRASGGGGGRRKRGLRGEAAGADQPPQDDGNTLYAEVMHELDRVKRELRKLQREVRSARAAAAATTTSATPRAVSSPAGVNGEAGGASEARTIVELAAEAGGGSRKGKQAAARTRRSDDASRGSTEEKFATASSSDLDLLRSEEMAMVPATWGKGHVENDESAAALTVTRHGEHDEPSLRAAEAELLLSSARVELASIKEEELRFVNSIERTREETAKVTEEIHRLTEQEKKAASQVQQLNAMLLRARSKLDAAAAADETAEAALAELSAALRRLGEETEAAEKERELTELESRCVREDAESVGAEIAATEQRVREAVRELEAARAAEAAATEELKAVLAGTIRAMSPAATPQRAGNVTIARFEYEYLAGRAEVVREIAGKKAAATEAWVEALRAGEKEVAMRAEAIEKEMGETMAGEGEAEAADGRRAHPRRRPRPTESKAVAATSSVVRKPRSPSFSVKRAVVPKYLKLMAGRCRGQN